MTTATATARRATQCADCGAWLTPADGDRPSHVALVGPPVRALARAIEEVALALRVAAEERADNRVREFRTTHPIARVMAEQGTSTSHVTADQVRGLQWVILHGVGKNADAVRRSYLAATLRHCEETSRPSDLPGAVDDYDHDAARGYAARLAALPQDVRRVLTAVARVGAQQGWPDAVATVERECFPAPVVTTYGEAGRPRRDRSQPTEAQMRTAQAEALLTAAVEAWEDRG